MKILLHIDDKERWPMVKNNVTHLVQAQRENDLDLKIEVVANGEAVLGLVKTQLTEEEWGSKAETLKPVLRICACHNSMNRFDLRADELYSFVEIVPAGILELAGKQDEGYAYIKP